MRGWGAISNAIHAEASRVSANRFQWVDRQDALGSGCPGGGQVVERAKNELEQGPLWPDAQARQDAALKAGCERVPCAAAAFLAVLPQIRRGSAQPTASQWTMA